MPKNLVLLAFACALFAPGTLAEDARLAGKRKAMIETIRSYAQYETGLLGADGISENILEAMGQTKRHLFVPVRYRSTAYANRPTPIGHGQTISQPFIVALMTHLAEVERDDTALEIGTGSGYQAAILSQLVRKVCTIEIIRPLGETAAELLRELGYDNVTVRIGDGYNGWPDCGPFDAIIVTAALGHVPPPLITQLATGGRLVMPVGPSGMQQLTVVEKLADGSTNTRRVGPVHFVPFTRSPK